MAKINQNKLNTYKNKHSNKQKRIRKIIEEIITFLYLISRNTFIVNILEGKVLRREGRKSAWGRPKGSYWMSWRWRWWKERNIRNTSELRKTRIYGQNPLHNDNDDYDDDASESCILRYIYSTMDFWPIRRSLSTCSLIWICISFRVP